MNFEAVATGMTEAVYRQLKTAVEIGRWPDGTPLTAQQKQISFEAILRYEKHHLPPEQRSGYIPPKISPPKIGSACDGKTATGAYDQVQPLRWQDNEEPAE